MQLLINNSKILKTFLFFFTISKTGGKIHLTKAILKMVFLLCFYLKSDKIKLMKVGVIMEIGINPSWSFAEVVDNLWTLRETYEDLLASFSYYDLHKKVLFMLKTRNAFYSLNFDVWKKDKIWNFMNHFEYYSTLKDMVKRGK